MLAHQVEIYHSIIQRKILAPNDFHDTAAVARALNDFEHRYNQIAKPFDWKFTRQDLAGLLDRIEQHTAAENATGAPTALPATDQDPIDAHTTDDDHGRGPPALALAA